MAMPPHGPLSHFQAGYWRRDQLSPGTFATICRVFEVAGPLDLPALEASLSALVARHDAIRARFEVVDGHPVQVIEPQLTVPLRVVDLRDRATGDRHTECERWVEAELMAPFDLDKGPLLRLTLLRRAAEDHVLLLAVHHIVCDGWSLDLLLSELGEQYAGFRAGRPPSHPAPPISYLDLVGWQRSEAAARTAAAARYWQTVCTPSPTSFVADYTGVAEGDTYESARRRFSLAPDTAERLAEVGRRLRVTAFIALLAGLKVALWSRSGRADLTVGSLFAGRTRPEAESMVGLFANVTLLRTSLADDLTFGELAGRVRGAVLDAAEHQAVPVDSVVPAALLRPAWDVWFNMLPAPTDELRIAGAQVRSRFPEPAATVVKTTPVWDGGNLTVTTWASAGQVQGYVDYNRRLLGEPEIDHIIAAFQSATAYGLNDPELRLSEIRAQL